MLARPRRASRLAPLGLVGVLACGGASSDAPAKEPPRAVVAASALAGATQPTPSIVVVEVPAVATSTASAPPAVDELAAETEWVGAEVARDAPAAAQASAAGQPRGPAAPARGKLPCDPADPRCAIRTGSPPCDALLELMRRCKNMPSTAMTAMAEALVSLKETLAHAPPEARKAVGDACAQNMSALRSACR
ncbi:MAG: hypothetical protein IT373_15620 [Polyangiaceae bacterium]|nr:hypothetical protein [Polyangiaceae bacterium]